MRSTPDVSPTLIMPRWSSRRLSDLLRTASIPLVLAVLACVAVLDWGGLQQTLMGGDLFLYTQLNPRKWLQSGLLLWNAIVAGGGSLHYSAGDFLLSAIEWPPRALGVSPAILQRAEFGILLIGILLFFFRLPVELGLTEMRSPRFLGSIAYTFSLALIVDTLNVLFLMVFFLSVALPTIYAKILKSPGRLTVIYIAIFCVTTQLIAYVYNNPPQTAVLSCQVIILCLFILFVQSERLVALRRTIILTIATMVLNLWWIIPAYVTTFDSTVRIIATTDISSWSWTASEASLINVWRMTAGWIWPHPEYVPWAGYYKSAPLQVMELWPPAVVGIALLLSNQRVGKQKIAIWLFAVMALVSVLIMKGIHPPFTFVNVWLYQHVPGYFLFREPTDKFSEVLAFAGAMLLTIVLDRVESMRSSQFGRIAWLPLMSLAALVLAAIATPSVSGMVTEDSPSRLAPLRVSIPRYWREAASYINGLPNDGGIAILPNDDYYQMLYRWGYYGLDSLAQALIDRPVTYLYDTPQGYTSTTNGLQYLDRQLIEELRAGRADSLAAALGSRGIRYVMLRHDVDPNIPGRRIIAPDKMANLLKETPDFTYLRTIGQLDLYVISKGLVREDAYAVTQADTLRYVQPSARQVADADVRGLITVSAIIPQNCSTNSSGESSSTRTIQPQIELLDHSLDGYSFRVTVRQMPVLLVLNQAFSQDWQASVSEEGPKSKEKCGGKVLQHVVVDGYANGWWLTESGTSIVHVVFSPQRFANLAYFVSASGVTCIILLLALSTARALIRRAGEEKRKHAGD